MKALIVIALLLSSAVSAPSDSAGDDFNAWKNGNNFLRSCDGASSHRLGMRPADSQLFDGLCAVWLTGVRQGMEVEDQFRPKHVSTDEASARAEIDYYKKLGIKGLELPNENACIPEEVPNDQLKLVVIKYMKDHPGLLNMHAAVLTVAAIKNEWPCRS
jgi:Ssp1 endopeptidase immunity protein Rap1a